MISFSSLRILIFTTLLFVDATRQSNVEILTKSDLFIPLEQPTEPKVLFNTNLDESDAEYWKRDAQNYLKNVIDGPKKERVEKMKQKKAKNIILFLGDGMSLATVAAARMYLGNENKQLSFEQFSHFGLSKTYCVDKQVADSACSATAYLSGVKANYGTMGLSAKVPINDCKGQNDPTKQTVSIAKWAQDQCKDTGLVTNAKVTDASPGGLYSHIANRNWENDKELRKNGCDPDETLDIARQLVENEVSKKMKVVLAGGREEFRDSSVLDEEGKPGKRGDKRDLIKEWVDSRTKQGKTQFVYDKQGLSTVANNTEYLLGLFNNGHCPYNTVIVDKKMQKPTLTEMTEAAIKHMLKQKNDNGFFLFIEGALIDKAHHDNYARIALDETREFAKAIALAQSITNENETLIVVTSDHAHTMTYNGHSKRGNDVLGLSSEIAMDGLPYTTLSYANGLGYYYTYHENGTRIDLSNTNLSNPYHNYPATIPLLSETHGGEDVGIYATGPKSHLFVGNYEQSYIPLLMANAAQIGPFAKENEKCYSKAPGGSTSASRIISPNVMLLFVLLSPMILSKIIRS
ncbi:membrane-bound alkaline phosphatase-like [Contarinia nasturtii]|uniref:membrane-bound alkaline phosphatase-like n=1 Tax=Contarinia nasturtii TaxID=265458 RepID=UPI0012D49688|nr:membrane-bound alkaline phosphatase-like [Contarinia nasturtii]